MPSYGLEWVQHWLQPEEDRAAAEAWKARSKCLDVGDEIAERLFFPVEPDTAKTEDERKQLLAQAKEQTKAGKRFCRGEEDGRPCPVLMDCLEYALAEQLWVGVWGGTSGRERRKYKVKLQRDVEVWRMRRTVRR